MSSKRNNSDLISKRVENSKKEVEKLKAEYEALLQRGLAISKSTSVSNSISDSNSKHESQSDKGNSDVKSSVNTVSRTTISESIFNYSIGKSSVKYDAASERVDFKSESSDVKSKNSRHSSLNNYSLGLKNSEAQSDLKSKSSGYDEIKSRHSDFKTISGESKKSEKYSSDFCSSAEVAQTDKTKTNLSSIVPAANTQTKSQTVESVSKFKPKSIDDQIIINSTQQINALKSKSSNVLDSDKSRIVKVDGVVKKVKSKVGGLAKSSEEMISCPSKHKKNYNVEEAREFMRRQKEKRFEEMKKKLKASTDTVEEKKKKLKELNELSLKIIAKNRERSRSRSKDPQPVNDPPLQTIDINKRPHIINQKRPSRDRLKPQDERQLTYRLGENTSKTKAAIAIQSYFRGYRQRKVYKDLLQKHNKTKENIIVEEEEINENLQNAVLKQENVHKELITNERNEKFLSNYQKENIPASNTDYYEKFDQSPKQSNFPESLTQLDNEHFPPWLQAKQSYPYNFISTLKQKLNHTLNLPAKTTEIGVQSSPQLSTKEIKERILNSLRNTSEDNKDEATGSKYSFNESTENKHSFKEVAQNDSFNTAHKRTEIKNDFKEITVESVVKVRTDFMESPNYKKTHENVEKKHTGTEDDNKKIAHVDKSNSSESSKTNLQELKEKIKQSTSDYKPTRNLSSKEIRQEMARSITHRDNSFDSQLNFEKFMEMNMPAKIEFEKFMQAKNKDFNLDLKTVEGMKLKTRGSDSDTSKNVPDLLSENESKTSVFDDHELNSVRTSLASGCLESESAKDEFDILKPASKLGNFKRLKAHAVKESGSEKSSSAERKGRRVKLDETGIESEYSASFEIESAIDKNVTSNYLKNAGEENKKSDSSVDTHGAGSQQSSRDGLSSKHSSQDGVSKNSRFGNAYKKSDTLKSSSDSITEVKNAQEDVFKKPQDILKRRKDSNKENAIPASSNSNSIISSRRSIHSEGFSDSDGDFNLDTDKLKKLKLVRRKDRKEDFNNTIEVIHAFSKKNYDTSLSSEIRSDSEANFKRSKDSHSQISLGSSVVKTKSKSPLNLPRNSVSTSELNKFSPTHRDSQSNSQNKNGNNQDTESKKTSSIESNLDNNISKSSDDEKLKRRMSIISSNCSKSPSLVDKNQANVTDDLASFREYMQDFKQKMKRQKNLPDGRRKRGSESERLDDHSKNSQSSSVDQQCSTGSSSITSRHSSKNQLSAVDELKSPNVLENLKEMKNLSKEELKASLSNDLKKLLSPRDKELKNTSSSIGDELKKSFSPSSKDDDLKKSLSSSSIGDELKKSRSSSSKGDKLKKSRSSSSKSDELIKTLSSSFKGDELNTSSLSPKGDALKTSLPTSSKGDGLKKSLPSSSKADELNKSSSSSLKGDELKQSLSTISKGDGLKKSRSLSSKANEFSSSPKGDEIQTSLSTISKRDGLKKSPSLSSKPDELNKSFSSSPKHNEIKKSFSSSSIHELRKSSKELKHPNESDLTKLLALKQSDSCTSSSERNRLTSYTRDSRKKSSYSFKTMQSASSESGYDGRNRRSSDSTTIDERLSSENAPLPLTAPEVSLHSNHDSDKENHVEIKLKAGEKNAVATTTNQIHVKFEAELHLLNDFNESLRQFMAIEKSLLDLQNNKSNVQHETRDTQTSFKSKSLTEGNSRRNEKSTSKSSPTIATLNYSRGSDFFPERSSIIDENHITNNDLSGNNSYVITNSLQVENTALEVSEMREESALNDESLELSKFFAKNFDDKKGYAGLSLGMFEQLIKDEDSRIENLKTILKIREKALLDRTKGELACLEIQKKQLLETGKLHEASLVKKKQRGILIKLQHEKHEMHKLKQMQKAASKERKTILKEQRNMIKAQLSTTGTMTKIKRTTSKERRSSGPLRVYNYHRETTLKSETSISKSSIAGELIYTSKSESVVGDRKLDSDEAEVESLMVNSRTEIAKRSLVMREAALQKRRKAAEELLQWHQKLLDEERKITELEMAASNIINQVPSLTVDNTTSAQSTYKFLGSQLNVLWQNMTGLTEKKFKDAETYNLTQIALERFCKDAKKHSGKKSIVGDCNASDSSLHEIMQNINSITDEISELYKLSSAGGEVGRTLQSESVKNNRNKDNDDQKGRKLKESHASRENQRNIRKIVDTTKRHPNLVTKRTSNKISFKGDYKGASSDSSEVASEIKSVKDNHVELTNSYNIGKIRGEAGDFSGRTVSEIDFNSGKSGKEVDDDFSGRTISEVDFNVSKTGNEVEDFSGRTVSEVDELNSQSVSEGVEGSEVTKKELIITSRSDLEKRQRKLEKQQRTSESISSLDNEQSAILDESIPNLEKVTKTESHDESIQKSNVSTVEDIEELKSSSEQEKLNQSVILEIIQDLPSEKITQLSEISRRDSSQLNDEENIESKQDELIRTQAVELSSNKDQITEEISEHNRKVSVASSISKTHSDDKQPSTGSSKVKTKQSSEGVLHDFVAKVDGSILVISETSMLEGLRSNLEDLRTIESQANVDFDESSEKLVESLSRINEALSGSSNKDFLPSNEHVEEDFVASKISEDEVSSQLLTNDAGNKSDYIASLEIKSSIKTNDNSSNHEVASINLSQNENVDSSNNQIPSLKTENEIASQSSLKTDNDINEVASKSSLKTDNEVVSKSSLKADPEVSSKISLKTDLKVSSNSSLKTDNEVNEVASKSSLKTDSEVASKSPLKTDNDINEIASKSSLKTDSDVIEVVSKSSFKTDPEVVFKSSMKTDNEEPLLQIQEGSSNHEIASNSILETNDEIPMNSSKIVEAHNEQTSKLSAKVPSEVSLDLKSLARISTMGKDAKNDHNTSVKRSFVVPKTDEGRIESDDEDSSRITDHLGEIEDDSDLKIKEDEEILSEVKSIDEIVSEEDERSLTASKEEDRRLTFTASKEEDRRLTFTASKEDKRLLLKASKAGTSLDSTEDKQLHLKASKEGTSLDSAEDKQLHLKSYEEGTGLDSTASEEVKRLDLKEDEELNLPATKEYGRLDSTAFKGDDGLDLTVSKGDVSLDHTSSKEDGGLDLTTFKKDGSLDHTSFKKDGSLDHTASKVDGEFDITTSKKDGSSDHTTSKEDDGLDLTKSKEDTLGHTASKEDVGLDLTTSKEEGRLHLKTNSASLDEKIVKEAKSSVSDEHEQQATVSERSSIEKSHLISDELAKSSKETPTESVEHVDKCKQLDETDNSKALQKKSIFEDVNSTLVTNEFEELIQNRISSLNDNEILDINASIKEIEVNKSPTVEEDLNARIESNKTLTPEECVDSTLSGELDSSKSSKVKDVSGDSLKEIETNDNDEEFPENIDEENIASPKEIKTNDNEEEFPENIDEGNIASLKATNKSIDNEEDYSFKEIDNSKEGETSLNNSDASPNVTSIKLSDLKDNKSSEINSISSEIEGISSDDISEAAPIIEVTIEDRKKKLSASEKDEDSEEGDGSERSKAQVSVKQRVSEILADAHINTPIGDKSPRMQDLYVTTYDVITPEGSPELGSPVENKSFSPKDIYGNEAEELLRKQLAIEQEIKQLEQQQQIPYLYMREIPNKPPPPYTPPVQTVPNLPPTVLPMTIEQISSMTPKISRILYEAHKQNNLLDVTLPENIHTENIDEECWEFVFDLCKEYTLEHYKQFEEISTVSWMKSANRHLGFKKQFDQPALKDFLDQRLRQVFEFEKVETKESMIIKWSRKKRDHVDELLVVESQAEETEWTNYNQDELSVRNEVTNDILKLLLGETAEVFRKIVAKRN